MTDIGARSARVRARRCHGQRRRLRRAPLARPDRRASREAVRHTSFCTHTAERWLPLRTAAAMCPAFGALSNSAVLSAIHDRRIEHDLLEAAFDAARKKP